MSRLGGGRSITDRVVFRQDEPPAVTDSVVWIDTSGEQPQAKIYDPVGVEWLSVGVVDYNNLINKPEIQELPGTLSYNSLSNTPVETESAFATAGYVPVVSNTYELTDGTFTDTTYLDIPTVTDSGRFSVSISTPDNGEPIRYEITIRDPDNNILSVMNKTDDWYGDGTTHTKTDNYVAEKADKAVFVAEVDSHYTVDATVEVDVNKVPAGDHVHEVEQ